MKLTICFYLLALALSLNTIFAQDNRAQTNQTTIAEEELPRFEIGGQYSAFEGSGFGGRFTFNLNRNVALEAEGNFFPGGNFRGRAVQGLFGVKAGKRWSKFGVFGKARPGFVYFNRGELERLGGTPENPIFRFSGRTDPAIDLGGVIEFYPTKRIIIRFDAGDTITRTGGASGFLFDQDGNTQPFRFPARTQHRLQFSAGVSFRF